MHDARSSNFAIRLHTATAVHSAPDLRAAWQAGRTLKCLDLRPLDRVLRLDPVRGLLEVQAGARWDAIDAWLANSPDAQGVWLRPDWRHHAGPATVGASVAANAPGFGVACGPIADDIEALTLLAADGELHRLSRRHEPRLFRLVLGGHGMFGVLYSATLRLERSGVTPLAHASAPDLSAMLSASGEPGGSTVQATAALFVPTQRAGQFLLDALEATAEHRVVVARAGAQRVIESEAMFLHPRVADRIEFTLLLCRSANLCARVRLEEACRRLAAIALDLGGGVLLSHGNFASREQIEASYPMLAGFMAEKCRHDPAGCFDNAWSRHYALLLRAESCEMRWAA